MVKTATAIPDLKGNRHPMRGRVVYVHPQGRYAVLEFEGVNGKFRECYMPEQLTDKNLVKRKDKWEFGYYCLPVVGGNCSGCA